MTQFFDICILITFIFIILVTILVKLKLRTSIINNKIHDIFNENFIVSDAEDFHNYDGIKKTIEEKNKKFDMDTINNPLAINKISYEEPDSNKSNIISEKKSQNSFITSSDYGWENPFPLVSCSNSSINKKYQNNHKRFQQNKISCEYPNKLTAENYYKTHYDSPVIKLEDYNVRGANYMEYSDYVHPTKSNIRLLSKNTKGLPPEETKFKNIPTGSNYAF